MISQGQSQCHLKVKLIATCYFMHRLKYYELHHFIRANNFFQKFTKFFLKNQNRRLLFEIQINFILSKLVEGSIKNGRPWAVIGEIELFNSNETVLLLILTVRFISSQI